MLARPQVSRGGALPGVLPGKPTRQRGEGSRTENDEEEIRALVLTLLRSVVVVLVGYIIFAASAFAVFFFSGQRAHAEATVPFMLVSVGSGIVFAVIGGYVAAWLAGRNPLAHGVAVAGLLAVGAAVSLASTLGHGAIWSQVAALVLMAPAAALGGWLRARRVR
jgi:O-antigen/teichoic acid export membrane protein